MLYNKPRNSPTYGKVTLDFNTIGEMVLEYFLFHGVTGSLITYTIYDIYNYIKSLKKEDEK